jgi:hypothetical protein
MGKLSIGLVFEAESDCTLHVMVGNSFPSCFQQRGWSGIPAKMYRRTLVMIDSLISWQRMEARRASHCTTNQTTPAAFTAPGILTAANHRSRASHYEERVPLELSGSRRA